MHLSLKTIISVIVFGVMLCVGAGAADAPTVSQIVFLQLQFDQSGVTLASSRTVEGKLKQLRAPENREISYDVTNNSGVIFTGALDDPLVKRLEYEDPDNPGQLKMKVVEVTEATVYLRIPYAENLREVTFYRSVSGRSATGETARAKIGSVDLSQIGGAR